MLGRERRRLLTVAADGQHAAGLAALGRVRHDPAARDHDPDAIRVVDRARRRQRADLAQRVA